MMQSESASRLLQTQMVYLEAVRLRQRVEVQPAHFREVDQMRRGRTGNECHGERPERDLKRKSRSHLAAGLVSGRVLERQKMII